MSSRSHIPPPKLPYVFKYTQLCMYLCRGNSGDGTDGTQIPDQECFLKCFDRAIMGWVTNE